METSEQRTTRKVEILDFLIPLLALGYGYGS